MTARRIMLTRFVVFCLIAFVIVYGEWDQLRRRIELLETNEELTVKVIHGIVSGAQWKEKK